MLDYTTKQIDEHIHEIKEYRERVTDTDKVGLIRVLQEHEGTTDFIRKYDELANLFNSCGKAALYLKCDVQKFKGYFYLAAKAGDSCFKLYEKGYRTSGALCCDNDFEQRNNVLHYAKSAILSGCKDLAISIVLEDSLLGSLILGDYERAKKYLPKDIKEIHKSEDFDLILWTIV